MESKRCLQARFALLADLKPSRYEKKLKVFQGALEAFAIHLLNSKLGEACATETLIADSPPAATTSIVPGPTQQIDFPNTQPTIPRNATYIEMYR